MVALAHVAERGIHLPDTMPFRIPWTDAVGSPSFLDDFLGHQRSSRERWRPESWSLLLVVFHGGEPIGAQDLRGENFAADRRFETGSWLGRAFQGRGLGTEMRRAALHLGFEGLGGRTAVSGAFEGNRASERVSEKLGYVETGEAYFAPRGEPQRERIFELDRDDWVASARPQVEIEGLEPCLALFGV